jgi:Endonuclease NucS
MPIHHAIWTVGDRPASLSPGKLISEKQLEDMIVADPRILSNEWMLIARQAYTYGQNKLDLLAIAPDGSLVLIELKRDRTPRDLVAQALDYAAWVENLSAEHIAKIYSTFSNGGSLNEAFLKRFGAELDEDSLNSAHQIILVASELDASTERIINYLNARDVAINAVFFQVFKHNDGLLLSRAWLIDPSETQANVISATRVRGEKEPWNGEFYVSYGHRSWDDARTYGFVSAGGGRWYSKTLDSLNPGDRIWVKIPKTGYVGVGRVIETVQPVRDMTLMTDAGPKPALEVLKDRAEFSQHADDPDMAEYAVRVEWLDAVPEATAINEVGLFGNQNTVCQPTTVKWRHTVDRLKTYFKKWDSSPAD